MPGPCLYIPSFNSNLRRANDTSGVTRRAPALDMEGIRRPRRRGKNPLRAGTILVLVLIKRGRSYIAPARSSEIKLALIAIGVVLTAAVSASEFMVLSRCVFQHGTAAANRSECYTLAPRALSTPVVVVVVPVFVVARWKSEDAAE